MRVLDFIAGMGTWALLAFGVWFGGVHGNSYAENATVFYIWLLFILLAVSFFGIAKFAAEKNTKRLERWAREPLPAWLRYPVTAAVVLGCASVGWLWTAGALVAVLLLREAIRDTARDYLKSEES